MTKWIAVSALAAVVGLGARATALAQDSQRIAFISMERVFADYYKTQRADARLKEQAQEFSEVRTALLDDLRTREEAFNAARQESQDQALSQEARDQKRDEAEQMLLELREKERELRTFEETKRKELEEQGRRMRSRIVDEINAVIKTHAQSNKLFAVVDSSGPSLNQIPVFVYADETADITGEILARLNADMETGAEESAVVAPPAPVAAPAAE